MKELIKRYNRIARDNYNSECQIKRIDDESWWKWQVGFYGMESLHEMIADGIRKGNFDWEDEYFMIDSETRNIKSFSTKEDITEWISIEI